MRRLLFVIGLSTLVCSVLVAATKHEKTKTHTVIMEAMEFRPKVLTVMSGDTIVWVNKDIVEHTATSAIDGAFEFEDDPGGSVTGSTPSEPRVILLMAVHTIRR